MRFHFKCAENLHIEIQNNNLLSLNSPIKNPYMSDNFDLIKKELQPTEINPFKSSDFL